MKKKFSLSLLSFAFMASQAWAQNPNLDYKYAVKLYNLSSYEKSINSYNVDDSPSYIDFTTSGFKPLHPTIAVQWSSDISRTHEIELTNFSSEKTTTTIATRNEGTGNVVELSQGDVAATYLSLRYEYIRNFNSQKDSKLVPSIGGSISSYYKKNDYTPDPAVALPSSQLSTGVRVHVIPRLTYHFNSKFFIDFNIPICTHNMAYILTKEQSNLLTDRQKNIHRFQFDQFPALYSGRLGLGFKI